MPPLPPETDSAPLDGKPELSEEERLWLRRFRRDQARLRWLGKMIYKTWPFWATVGGAATAAIVWIKAHGHFFTKG